MSELVNDLREEARALHNAAWQRRDGGQDCTLSAMLAEKAALPIPTQEGK